MNNCLAKQGKICGVCGDNAIGKNYGAIACESCKVFFRRTALKTNVKNCQTNGNCIINLEKRTSCKKCRLNKCQSIGMIKELVLRNLNKCADLSKTKQNEQDCFNTSNHSLKSADDSSFDSDFDSIFANSCLSDEEISAEIMEIEEFIDNSVVSEQQINDMSVIPVVKPIATFDKSLNDIELNRLKELSNASNCFEISFSPIDPKIIEFSSIKEYYMHEESYAVNQFDTNARQYVKFCKRLDTFREICELDQLALIKNGHSISQVFQHFTLFNFNEENWTSYLGNGYSLRFSLKLLKAENNTQYKQIINFLRRLSNDWIWDPIIRNLLTAVSLFNWNISNVTHKGLVRLKQEMYLYLLQRYLTQKYRSECQTMEKLSQIMNCMKDLHIVADTQQKIGKSYKQVMTPLLKELIE